MKLPIKADALGGGILSSRLFKFIVGGNVNDNATEFLVHEEAIAQLSKPLYNLMKGGMSESQAGCTVWADVSKETFERFTQFAYTGDYSIPKGRERNRAEVQEAATDYSSQNSFHMLRERLGETKGELVGEGKATYSWGSDLERCGEDKPTVGHFAKSKKDKKKSRSKKKSLFYMDKRAETLEDLPAEDPPAEPAGPYQEIITTTKRDKYPELHSRVHSDDFQSLTFPLLAPRNNHDETCEPVENFDTEKSYTEIFLSHASLYILGDLQLIDSLKVLALFKLHKTLCVFQLDDENAEDIIALARYIYSEEGGGGGLDEEIGDLRSLVCQYMATNAVVLSFHDEFLNLLGGGGQLVKDFFKYEVQRTN